MLLFVSHKDAKPERRPDENGSGAAVPGLQTDADGAADGATRPLSARRLFNQVHTH